MNEYLECLGHILQSVWNNITGIKDLSYIFFNCVSGVSIIKGIGYLKRLKEKKNAATFSFWSQFRIRIWELYSWLKDEYGLVNNLYEPVARKAWEDKLGSKKERIEQFMNMVEETICFIQSTPDQMPAYKGWTTDYNIIVSFLNDVIQYDIKNSQEYFKYSGQITKLERNNNCKFICDAMERLCNQIEEKQIEIEKLII